jgi:hypothetical protein
MINRAPDHRTEIPVVNKNDRIKDFYVILKFIIYKVLPSKNNSTAFDCSGVRNIPPEINHSKICHPIFKNSYIAA